RDGASRQLCNPCRSDGRSLLGLLPWRPARELAAPADWAAARDRCAAFCQPQRYRSRRSKMGIVKGLAAIIGVVALLMGGLWALQGLDIVRWPSSSFMLGDPAWTRNGVVLVVVGVVLLWFARKR